MERAPCAFMKYLWIGCLLVAGCPIFAGTQDSEFNVNTRYTVENILVAGAGWTTDLVASHDDHISFGIRRDLVALIGQKLNPAALDEVVAYVQSQKTTGFLIIQNRQVIELGKGQVLGVDNRAGAIGARLRNLQRNAGPLGQFDA